jgi:hypothetical protein
MIWLTFAALLGPEGKMRDDKHISMMLWTVQCRSSSTCGSSRSKRERREVQTKLKMWRQWEWTVLRGLGNILNLWGADEQAHLVGMWRQRPPLVLLYEANELPRVHQHRGWWHKSLDSVKKPPTRPCYDVWISISLGLSKLCIDSNRSIRGCGSRFPGSFRIDFQSHFVCIFRSGTIADEWTRFDGPSACLLAMRQSVHSLHVDDFWCFWRLAMGHL